MRIIVDADACPRNVLEICKKAAREKGAELYTVANYHHQIESDHHVTADSNSQSTDIIVANLSRPGDIVVTQDLGLAALVLGKKAFAISTKGDILNTLNMDQLLEIREARSKLRRKGHKVRNKIRKREKADDERFARNLYKLIEKAAG